MIMIHEHVHVLLYSNFAPAMRRAHAAVDSGNPISTLQMMRGLSRNGGEAPSKNSAINLLTIESCQIGCHQPGRPSARWSHQFCDLIKMHAVATTGVKAMRSVATRSISRAMSKAPNAGGCPRIAPIPRNMAEETKKIEEWWATSRTSAMRYSHLLLMRG